VPHQNDHSRDPLEQASQIARSGAKLESMRMQVAAENIANMNDTPDPKTRKPYVRKVVFVKRDGILISPKVKRDKKRKAFKKIIIQNTFTQIKRDMLQFPTLVRKLKKEIWQNHVEDI
jgi:flagellar basal body rod protein FlgC